MRVNRKILNKADPELREALKNAEGEEVLSAILLLGPDQEERCTNTEELSPSQFPSRTDWRKALIAQRQQQMEQEIGGTIQALRDLGLEPHGGTITRAVVVQKEAQQVVKALELPGVRHASLDQPIDLIR